jgi:hypothetical protein
MTNQHIINLLPPKEKDALALERAKNLILVLGNMTLVFMICLVLVLLWLKFYLLGEITYQKYLLYGIEGSSPSDITDLKTIIQKYNKTMPSVVNVYQNSPHFSDILDIISKVERPQGLYFKNISLDGQKYQDKIEAKITGFSSTRDNLLLFKKNLESQPAVENILFSPDSWINPVNTTFNLTIDFKKL